MKKRKKNVTSTNQTYKLLILFLIIIIFILISIIFYAIEQSKTKETSDCNIENSPTCQSAIYDVEEKENTDEDISAAEKTLNFETEPTTEEVTNFTVPASDPRYISIPSIGNADKRQVVPVQLADTGAIEMPTNIFQAGWYTGSAKPGTGGAIVIDGHNSGPNVVGIFKYLPNAKIGEKVIIERGDGAIFTYTIVKNDTIPLDQSDAYMREIFKIIDGKETVTVITCTGEWSQTRQTYLSRQYLRAVLSDAD